MEVARDPHLADLEPLAHHLVLVRVLVRLPDQDAVPVLVVLYIVLYCTALYRTILYYTALYCTVLYCTVLYCTVLYLHVRLVHALPARQIDGVSHLGRAQELLTEANVCMFASEDVNTISRW